MEDSHLRVRWDCYSSALPCTDLFRPDRVLHFGRHTTVAFISVCHPAADLVENLPVTTRSGVVVQRSALIVTCFTFTKRASRLNEHGSPPWSYVFTYVLACLERNLSSQLYKYCTRCDGWHCKILNSRLVDIAGPYRVVMPAAKREQLAQSL